jgi:3',5'-cyclic AMP phosphodiesterase CpdA
MDPQVDWLRNVLEANDSRWTVLSFHYPVFSSGKDRDNKELRAAWKPLIDKFKVDLVLQGHDHTYARGQTPQVPTRFSTQDGASTAVSSVFVNSVSGPKQYEFNEEGWDHFKKHDVTLQRQAENTQFYQVIHIDGNTLVYKAYTAAGTLYDGFTLRKKDDGSKIMEQMENLPATRLFKNTGRYTKDGMK